jgi:hypothetical protein
MGRNFEKALVAGQVLPKCGLRLFVNSQGLLHGSFRLFQNARKCAHFESIRGPKRKIVKFRVALRANLLFVGIRYKYLEYMSSGVSSLYARKADC